MHSVLLPPMQKHSRSSRLRQVLRYGSIAVGVVGIIALSLAIGMVMTTSRQTNFLASGDPAFEKLDELLDVIGKAKDDRSVVEKLDQIIASHQASSRKYVVPHLPPRKNQFARGTCWDFATIAILEHQYRLQGIEQGYLKENEYTQFSEQAYANAIVEICKKFPDTCDIPGDRVAHNSSNGGEVHLLYEFRDYLNKKIVPISVCPYIKDRDDWSCPGLEKAYATNPVEFKIDAAANYFDPPHVKEALRAAGHAMAIGSPMWDNLYFMPCSPDMDVADCRAETCKPCPEHLSSVSKCCTSTMAFANHDGEFVERPYSVLSGGHAMMIAGFNDDYVTRDGKRGAFILRNTWQDGRGSGSHSIPYLMSWISDTTERALCPNSWNARYWYQCESVEQCTSARTAHTAELAYSPLKLQCRNPQFGCVVDENVFYYLHSKEWAFDESERWCFLEVNEATKASREVCFTMPPDVLPKVLGPIPSQQYKGVEDVCGYYAFPYDMAYVSKQKWGLWWINDYHFTFTPASYVANAAQNPQFDYTLLKESTKTQKPLPYTISPYPNPSPGSDPIVPPTLTINN